MRSVKRLCLVLFLLLSSLMLSAFHGRKDTKAFQVPESFDASREYELTFWAKNDSNVTQVKVYKKAAEDFHTLYPNVTVNLKLYSDYKDIYNDVITNINTGTTPNVCITYPDHIATYMTGDNIVVALDDLMANKKYGLGGTELKFDGPTKAEIADKFLKEGIIDGYYYDLPFMRSTEALYVNKTYVEKMGYVLPEVVTWDYIWEVSEAAMEKNADGTFKSNGQKVMIPFIYKSTDNMMIQMLRQKNAPYSTDKGEVLIFSDETKAVLTEIAKHALSRAFSIHQVSGYPANSLNRGQCIFAIDSTAGATWMGSGAPLLDIDPAQVVEFETVVLPIPQEDAANPLMISQGPSVCIFNKEDPQEVLASWLFTQYLLTNEVQIPYAKTEGYVPVTLKAQNSAEYQNYLSRAGEDNNEFYDVKIAASKLLLANMDHTFVTPVFNGSASLRDAAGHMITTTTKSARFKETIDDEYLEKLFTETVKLKHLDQITVSDGSGGGTPDLGPLPETSLSLLYGLGSVWVCIGIYGVYRLVKRKKS